jgi:hypothetical protein
MAKKRDIFARNGARPATEPGQKIGQGALAAHARLGLAELRNAASLNPQPAAEVQRSAQPQPQQQARPPQQTRPQPQRGRSM